MDSPGSGTRSIVGGCCVPIIRAQAKEGQGRPDDENGRHRTCLPVIIKKYKKREAIAPPYSLCEHETIAKLILIVDRRSSCLPDELVDEPIVVPLEYTFALDSMLRENSIQAGFGGDRLITTVEDLNKGVTDSGNVVAVQIHFRLVSFRVVSNSGVVFLPVLIVRNGGVHLLFDLTHGVVSFEQW